MAFTSEQLQQVAAQARQSMQADTFMDDKLKQNFYKTVDQLVDYLGGKTETIPVIQIAHARESSHYDWFQELVSDIAALDEQDQRIFNALSASQFFSMFITPIFQRIATQIEAQQDDTLPIKAMNSLRNYGLTDEAAIQSLAGSGLSSTSTAYYTFFYNKPAILVNAAGKYIASVFETHQEEIIASFMTDHNSDDWSKQIVNYLARHTQYDLSGFLYYKNYSTTYMSFGNAISMANHSPAIHDEALVKAYQEGTVYITSPKLKYFILRGLANAFPEKYRSQQIEQINAYFKQIDEQINQNKSSYWGYREPSYWTEDENGHRFAQQLTPIMLDDLFVHDAANARQTAQSLLTNIPVRYIQPATMQVIEKRLGADSIDILAQGLLTDKGNGSTLKNLLEILGKHDYSRHLDKVWNITKDKVKGVRTIVVIELAKLGDAALPKCQELLEAKSAEVRQTVAVVLARIKSEKAEKILLETVNSEKNDDARDVMIEALGEKCYQNLTEAQLTDLIAAARMRGKLNTPTAPWLVVDALPKLHTTEGRVLTSEEILFLFYRMSRAKEIRTDVEARPLLQRIDRKTSGEFARKLFKLYIDNGGDAKQKYCLTLAGLLGDDSMVDVIRPQITKWVEASRGKMAEYGVVALALLGTNKALRAVEFFSRKYKNKNSNIGAAALEALQIAAEELGMDMNELADSIIPDFGFENMYKTFNVGEDEFRAFVNKDFKLAFLNEDGKLLKSAPKGTSKELLDEFKEIGKEIRDVVKSQSSRMELYLVIQRRWQPEAWQKFFVGNPIMFVYATHLLWGVFDADGSLKHCFYCNEDTSLLNLEDEEIALPEDRHIGMVHPMSLSAEDQQAWTAKFFDLGIEPVFPQLQRPVVALKDSDKDLTEIEEFNNRTGNAAQVKGTFKRLGWVNWELGDHGDIYSFSKLFHELGVQAIIETSGGLFMGYYDESMPAEFGKLDFRKISDKWYHEPHLPLGQVPPIVYSEVISELRQIVPKEETA